MQTFISLTAEQISLIRQEAFDLTGFYVLEQISIGADPESFTDETNYGIWVSTLYKQGYFSPERGLSQQGKDFLQRVKDVIEKKTQKSLAEQFRDIFPSKKLPSGKYFKSPLRDIEKRLTYFKKYYKYTDDEILRAAKAYVKHAEDVDFKFIRTSMYFIYKEHEGSDLASWCEEFRPENSTPAAKPTNIENLF
jgi:hypothetical protein